MQERDIYRAIEEAFRTQIDRDIQQLLIRDTDMTDSQLHTIRGQAVATDNMLRKLRNTLGYDHTDLS